MDPDDAARCVQLGVEGVWVSNHGGRQLDHSEAPISVLPEIAQASQSLSASASLSCAGPEWMRLPQAVAGRATIIIDSGFMRGTDVVKAMALGADLVGVGRMAAFALAAGGEEGVVKFVRSNLLIF